MFPTSYWWNAEKWKVWILEVREKNKVNNGWNVYEYKIKDILKKERLWKVQETNENGDYLLVVCAGKVFSLETPFLTQDVP